MRLKFSLNRWTHKKIGLGPDEYFIKSEYNYMSFEDISEESKKYLVRYLQYLNSVGRSKDSESDILSYLLKSSSFKLRAKGLWKIHLFVPDPKNQDYVKKWLISNSQYNFKIMPDHEEKTFTIYIGSFKDMIEHAKTLERSLSNYLGPSIQVWSDAFITKHVAARFEPWIHINLKSMGWNLPFSYSFDYYPLMPESGVYGAHGITPTEFELHYIYSREDFKELLNAVWRAHIFYKKVFDNFYDDGRLTEYLRKFTKRKSKEEIYYVLSR